MNNDNLRKLDDCRLELVSIKKWINSHAIDSNVKYLVSYSIIKASGTIEVVLKNMVFEYLSTNAQIDTKKYLEKMIIDASFNPNTGNICRLLEQFDGHKKEEFDKYTKNTIEKNSLNSLVSLRNDIAHGRTNNVSIENVYAYFNHGKKILIKLEKIINNCK